MPAPLLALTHAVRKGLGACLRDGEQAVLLAVSGGPDSLALLDACAQLAALPGSRWRFEVCWVDHGVRPASAADPVGDRTPPE